MSNKKVWLVTGASKGLGRSLVTQLLDKGYKVAATSRDKQALEGIAGATKENFLPLTMLLTSEENVKAGIQDTIRHFGRVDVVVNNAGYGLAGSIEELTDEESRANFDVNVFGLLNVVRQVMPFLREQGSGHIINISSIGGFYGGFPGWGIYCATKFAVNGLTESLREEVKDFGIHVTVVEPGYFRTDFLGGSMGWPKNEIPAYRSVRASQQFHQDLNGNQPGDPEKGVAALITLTESEEPPVNLFLGQDAYDMAYAKMEQVKGELEKWKELTVSTGFAK